MIIGFHLTTNKKNPNSSYFEKAENRDKFNNYSLNCFIMYLFCNLC